ncbi:centrosomal protein of 78 kDa-like [Prorops nasuta]|uniref:centrosomal protein of 78 kDa-like n=1 Tax=Prorops nasuta TaxID=863751 RepID=UPI0034CEAEC2
MMNSRAITTLILDGIPLPLKYINILAEGLLHNRNLKSLSLARCEIGDLGCDVILHSLENNPNLRELDLSSCNLTNRSAMFLGIFFRKNMEAAMTKHKIHSEATFVRKITGLNTLILNKNQKFRNDGVRHLASNLKNNYRLRKLKLQGCGLSAIGGHILVNLLRTNYTLTIIDIKDNYIPPFIMEAIFCLLKKRHIEDKRNLKPRKSIIEKHLCLKLSNKRSKRNSKNVRNRVKNGLKLERMRILYKIYNNPWKVKKPCSMKATKYKVEKKKQTRNNKHYNSPNGRYHGNFNLNKLKLYVMNVHKENKTLRNNLEQKEKVIKEEKKQRLKAEKNCEEIKPQIQDLEREVLIKKLLPIAKHDKKKLFQYLQTNLETLKKASTSEHSKMKFNLKELQGINENTKDKSYPILKSTPTIDNLCPTKLDSIDQE